MNKDFESNWEANVSVRRDQATAPTSKNGNAIKQIVTIRLDVDMLEWFKAEGPGYQTRINQVLRDHMAAQQRASQES
ncbi:BrnA antitoxin family protein [Pseudoduganella sp. GCM10020061]|uniref:BrnA antitoxin family protein n=1 Tax=Pseudoduganella sp. GCM10020061 TaxID=3317345 RepID=UPI00362D1285